MGERINSGWAADALRAMFGLQGGDVLPAMADELLSVAVVDNDRPEWGFARGEPLLGYGSAVVAAVGEFSYLAITNPADSGVLVIVTSVRTQPSTAGASNGVQLFHDVSTTALAGVISSSRGIVRDTRWIPPAGGTNGGAAVTDLGNDASPSATANSMGVILAGSGATNSQDRYDQPLIMAPGRRLLAMGNVVNNLISVHFSWRERRLEKGLKG